MEVKLVIHLDTYSQDWIKLAEEIRQKIEDKKHLKNVIQVRVEDVRGNKLAEVK